MNSENVLPKLRCRRFPLTVRIIASLLVITFLVQDIVWAHPDICRNPSASKDTLAPDTFFRQDGSREKAATLSLELLIENHPSLKSNISLPAIERLLKVELKDWLDINGIRCEYEKKDDKIVSVSAHIPAGYVLRYYDLKEDASDVDDRYEEVPAGISSLNNIAKQVFKVKGLHLPGVISMPEPDKVDPLKRNAVTAVNNAMTVLHREERGGAKTLASLSTLGSIAAVSLGYWATGGVILLVGMALSIAEDNREIITKAWENIEYLNSIEKKLRAGEPVGWFGFKRATRAANFLAHHAKEIASAPITISNDPEPRILSSHFASMTALDKLTDVLLSMSLSSDCLRKFADASAIALSAITLSGDRSIDFKVPSSKFEKILTDTRLSIPARNAASDAVSASFNRILRRERERPGEDTPAIMKSVAERYRSMLYAARRSMEERGAKPTQLKPLSRILQFIKSRGFLTLVLFVAASSAVLIFLLHNNSGFVAMGPVFPTASIIAGKLALLQKAAPLNLLNAMEQALKNAPGHAMPRQELRDRFISKGVNADYVEAMINGFIKSGYTADEGGVLRIISGRRPTFEPLVELIRIYGERKLKLEAELKDRFGAVLWNLDKHDISSENVRKLFYGPDMQPNKATNEIFDTIRKLKEASRAIALAKGESGRYVGYKISDSPTSCMCGDIAISFVNAALDAGLKCGLAYENQYGVIISSHIECWLVGNTANVKVDFALGQFDPIYEGRVLVEDMSADSPSIYNARIEKIVNTPSLMERMIQRQKVLEEEFKEQHKAMRIAMGLDDLAGSDPSEDPRRRLPGRDIYRNIQGSANTFPSLLLMGTISAAALSDVYGHPGFAVGFLAAATLVTLSEGLFSRLGKSIMSAKMDSAHLILTIAWIAVGGLAFGSAGNSVFAWAVFLGLPAPWILDAVFRSLLRKRQAADRELLNRFKSHNAEETYRTEQRFRESQIGKRSHAYLSTLKLSDDRKTGSIIAMEPNGSRVSVDLLNTGINPLERVKIAINKMQIRASHRDILLSILSHFQNSPPDFYVYNELFGDLFGFSSATNNIIALYRDLLNEPIAVFHEIAHLMMLENMTTAKEKLLTISLVNSNNTGNKFKNIKIRWFSAADKAYVEIADLPLSMATMDFINKEKKDWPKGWARNHHYLLRIMQYELFGIYDNVLTSKLHLAELSAQNKEIDAKMSQEPDASGMDAINRVNMYIAYYNKNIAIISDMASEVKLVTTDGKEKCNDTVCGWFKHLNSDATCLINLSLQGSIVTGNPELLHNAVEALSGVKIMHNDVIKCTPLLNRYEVLKNTRYKGTDRDPIPTNCLIYYYFKQAFIDNKDAAQNLAVYWACVRNMDLALSKIENAINEAAQGSSSWSKPVDRNKKVGGILARLSEMASGTPRIANATDTRASDLFTNEAAILTAADRSELAHELIKIMSAQGSGLLHRQLCINLLRLIFGKSDLNEEPLRITADDFAVLWHIVRIIPTEEQGRILESIAMALSNESLIITGDAGKRKSMQMTKKLFGGLLDKLLKEETLTISAQKTIILWSGFISNACPELIDFAMDFINDKAPERRLANNVLKLLMHRPDSNKVLKNKLLEMVTSSASFKNIPANVNTSEEAWNALFGNQENAREFFRYTSLLRKLYPASAGVNDDRPPLKYALEEGLYFKIGENLFVTPVTESFRRHLIFSRNADGRIKFAFEVIMPGEAVKRRGVGVEDRRRIAEELNASYKDYCVKPIGTKQFSDGKYEVYAESVDFGGDTPFNIIGFDYAEDGKRLDYVESEELDRIAAKISVKREDLDMAIARRVGTLTAATHEMGYIGHNSGQAASSGARLTYWDHHIGNFRLIVRDSGEGLDRIVIKFVGDFEAFEKAAAFNSPAKEEALDRKHIIDMTSARGGLSGRLKTLSQEHLLAIFEEERELIRKKSVTAAPAQPATGAETASQKTRVVNADEALDVVRGMLDGKRSSIRAGGDNRPILVIVDGDAGVGKSAFTEYLKNNIGFKAGAIHLDRYQNPIQFGHTKNWSEVHRDIRLAAIEGQKCIFIDGLRGLDMEYYGGTFKFDLRIKVTADEETRRENITHRRSWQYMDEDVITRVLACKAEYPALKGEDERRTEPRYDIIVENSRAHRLPFTEADNGERRYYERLNADGQRNIQRVNKHDDPAIAEILAAFLAGGSRKDATDALAKRLLDNYPDEGDDYAAAEKSAGKLIALLSRQIETGVYGKTSGVENAPITREVVLNGERLALAQMKQKVSEMIKGFFRFNARLEDGVLCFGCTENSAQLHNSIKYPPTAMGTFAGFVTSEGSIFILPEFVRWIAPQGEDETRRYHDLCIKLARVLIECGFPGSLPLNWQAKESLEEELLFDGSKLQTLGDLAGAPLIRFDSMPVHAPNVDQTTVSQGKPEKIERKTKIGIIDGLHVTPSLIISDLAGRIEDEFHINITLRKSGSDYTTSANIPMGVTSLCALCGDEVVFSARGPYSSEKLNKVLDVFQKIVEVKNWSSEFIAKNQKHKEVVREYLNEVRKSVGFGVMEDIRAEQRMKQTADSGGLKMRSDNGETKLEPHENLVRHFKEKEFRREDVLDVLGRLSRKIDAVCQSGTNLAGLEPGDAAVDARVSELAKYVEHFYQAMDVVGSGNEEVVAAVRDAFAQQNFSLILSMFKMPQHRTSAKQLLRNAIEQWRANVEFLRAYASVGAVADAVAITPWRGTNELPGADRLLSDLEASIPGYRPGEDNPGLGLGGARGFANRVEVAGSPVEEFLAVVLGHITHADYLTELINTCKTEPRLAESGVEVYDRLKSIMDKYKDTISELARKGNLTVGEVNALAEAIEELMREIDELLVSYERNAQKRETYERMMKFIVNEMRGKLQGLAIGADVGIIKRMQDQGWITTLLTDIRESIADLEIVMQCYKYALSQQPYTMLHSNREVVITNPAGIHLCPSTIIGNLIWQIQQRFKMPISLSNKSTGKTLKADISDLQDLILSIVGLGIRENEAVEINIAYRGTENNALAEALLDVIARSLRDSAVLEGEDSGGGRFIDEIEELKRHPPAMRDIERAPVTMEDICHTLLNWLDDKDRQRIEKIEYDVFEDSRVSPEVDVNRLEDALMEVIHNALDHSDPSQKITVRLTPCDSPEFVNFNITNYGSIPWDLLRAEAVRLAENGELFARKNDSSKIITGTELRRMPENAGADYLPMATGEVRDIPDEALLFIEGLSTSKVHGKRSGAGVGLRNAMVYAKAVNAGFGVREDKAHSQVTFIISNVKILRQPSAMDAGQGAVLGGRVGIESIGVPGAIAKQAIKRGEGLQGTGATPVMTGPLPEMDVPANVAKWSVRQILVAIHAVNMEAGCVAAPLPQDASVVLSRNLFGDDFETSPLMGLFKSSANIEIAADSKTLKVRATNESEKNGRDRRIVVMTEDEFKTIWPDEDGRRQIRSSVLLLKNRLTDKNYLYVEGVVRLAFAMMKQDQMAVAAYYQLMSGKKLDIVTQNLFGDNAVAFAVKAVLEFRPADVKDEREFTDYKIMVENALIRA